MYRIYWKPEEEKGAAADFIPYYDDGKFHLFYLYDHRNAEKYGDGISWYKVVTSDLINFESRGEMIPAGSRNELDLCAFTGGIIKHEGVYHIFYTGHNIFIKTRAYQNECIMHAVSSDLEHWKKIKEDTFYAPEGYDAGDFRDPHVYYNEERGLFTMLLCARPSDGERLRKGETIAMASGDLKKWEFDRVVYAPCAYHTHECPDLFKMGDWWYLIFSEYSDDYVTKYRMSRSPNGPWVKPADDGFDGRAYYAAKTASDGKDRYLFGWNPTRIENADNKPWMWGGNLIIHKLMQHADGTLGVCMPENVKAKFSRQESLGQRQLYNLYTCGETEILRNIPSACIFTATAKPHTTGTRFGIALGEKSGKDRAFAFYIDLERHELSVNMRPAFPAYEFDNYHLTRPVAPADAYKLELAIDGDIFVLYVNGVCALTVRLCAFRASTIQLIADYCDVVYEDITLNMA